MDLVFLTNLYPPYIVGGNEMLCEEVVTALRRRGHRVAVVCGRGARLPHTDDLHGLLEIDLDRKDETFLGGRLPTACEAVKLHAFSPASYAATRRFLRARHPDLVVVWNLYLASLAPLIAARRSSLPIVVHVFDKWLYHGLCDLTSLLGPQVAWKRGLLRLFEATLQPLLRRLARPPVIVAVSRFLEQLYLRAGFPAESLSVERLGVPTAEFALVPRAPRVAGAPLRLLYVGALWEGKGPFTAVRALGQLIHEGLTVHLDVCGDGAPRFVEALRALIAQEGLAERVTLRGRVTRDVVRQLCATHDVLVFPSEWDEPFAAVPLEAMSTGLAVVATTAGGTPEAIDDGVTGLLVPPRDPTALAAALRRLAQDDDLRRRLGENASRAVRERFDFEGYVDRLEARYTRLTGGGVTR